MDEETFNKILRGAIIIAMNKNEKTITSSSIITSYKIQFMDDPNVDAGIEIGNIYWYNHVQSGYKLKFKFLSKTKKNIKNFLDNDAVNIYGFPKFKIASNVPIIFQGILDNLNGISELVDDE